MTLHAFRSLKILQINGKFSLQYNISPKRGECKLPCSQAGPAAQLQRRSSKLQSLCPVKVATITISVVTICIGR